MQKQGGPVRNIFLAIGFLASAFAQDTARALAPLTEQDPKGSACGSYFRADGGNIIYHVQGEGKSSSQPLAYIAKIVLDDKVGVPALLSKPIAEGALLTIVMSSAQRKDASCLPDNVYVEKRQ
jgi:hypothetical protein